MLFRRQAEVRDLLAEILGLALLSIRAAADHGDAAYCAVEANHVHNLPRLLKHYDAQELEYYLNVTRRTYLEQLAKLPHSNIHAYDPLWARLAKHAV
jgi:hypothetical protein